MDEREKCDKRCPAEALVVVIKGKLSLAFCGHHYGEDAALLELDGWRVALDRRGELARVA